MNIETNKQLKNNKDMKTTTVYQSGADTYEVNDLLLFSENTESLYLTLNSLFAGLYKREKQEILTEKFFNDLFSVFMDACIKMYKKEIGDISLTYEQKTEFINIHIKEYDAYKFDNKLV